MARELVRRARAGEPRAEEALFRKHAPYITALSFKLLGDRSEAEDIVQDTFLDAIRHLRDLAEPISLRQWLAGIAVHKVHRRFRRRRLQSLLGLHRATDSVVLEACDNSGESVAVFARRMNLVAQRIFWWRRRLRDAAAGPSAAAAFVPMVLRPMTAEGHEHDAPAAVILCGTLRVELRELTATSAAWTCAVARSLVERRE